MLFVRGVTKSQALSLPPFQTTSKASPEPKTHLSKHVAPGERTMASCTAHSGVRSVTQLHGMPRPLPTLHAPLSARRSLVNSARRLPRTLASTSAESSGAPTHAAPVAAARPPLPPLPPLDGACAAGPRVRGAASCRSRAGPRTLPPNFLRASRSVGAHSCPACFVPAPDLTARPLCLPRPTSFPDTYESVVTFSDSANWLVPGSLLLGRYPGVEPSRCRSRDQAEAQVCARAGGRARVRAHPRPRLHGRAWGGQCRKRWACTPASWAQPRMRPVPGL
jgi:hypothetical protein